MTAYFADHLFLVCHDEHTGRARVHRDVLGLALGAGLLVELLFPPEQVWLDAEGAVSMASCHGLPPLDPLQHQVVDLIRRERGAWDVGTWVRVLADDARQRVGRRLLDAGLVSRTERRLLRGPGEVYPARQPEWAAYATTRLHRALHHDPMHTLDVMLAALVYSVGLRAHLVYGCESAHPSLEDLAAELPARLRVLLCRTRSAMAASTLSPR